MSLYHTSPSKGRAVPYVCAGKALMHMHDAYTHTHAHANAHAYTHTHTVHAHAHAHARALTCTRTRTRTHTHTHARARACHALVREGEPLLLFEHLPRQGHLLPQEARALLLATVAVTRTLTLTLAPYPSPDPHLHPIALAPTLYDPHLNHRWLMLTTSAINAFVTPLVTMTVCLPDSDPNHHPRPALL